MSSVLIFGQPIVVGSLASDPVSAKNGQIYYNTGSNTFRIYQNGSWTPIASGSVSLTGQALNQNNIIVGDGSNLSASADTSALGNILADSATGLTIKAASIVNSMISGSAAIAYSKLNLTGSIVNADIASSAAIALTKLAALTNHNRVLVSDGSGFISESSVTTTTLGFLDATSSIQTQLNGKANTALSNLASVAVNVDMLPAGSGVRQLGSASNEWLSVDAVLYKVGDGTGTTLINASVAQYNDTGGNLSIDMGNRLFYNSASQLVGSYDASELYDVAGFTSVGWEARILYGPTSNPMFDWSTTGVLDAKSNKISNLADPTVAQDATTKFYVDNAVAGLSWKTYARAASVANLNLASMPAAVDGITLTSGDRFLAKNQTTASQNGIYVFNGTGSAATRSTDMDTWNEVVGAVLLITEGTVNAGSKWVNQNIAGGTLNTTAITFTAFSIAGTVNGTGTSGYVTYWSGTSTLTAEQFLSTVRGGTGGDSSAATGIAHVSSGTWSYSLIVNADVSASAAIAYSKLNLSNSIVNADINAAAAIAYSKLNLSASIVNADIAAAAAIARNKLAALTANRVLFSDASGFDTDSNSSDPSMIANNLHFGPSAGNTMEKQYVHSITLTNNTASPTAVNAATTFAFATYMGIQVDYTMEDGSSPTIVRQGTIKILVNSDGSIPSKIESSHESADIGVLFTAVTNGSNVELRYTTTNTTNRTMRAYIQRFLV